MRPSTTTLLSTFLLATLACSSPTDSSPWPIEPDPLPNPVAVDLWISATGLVLARGERFQQGFRVRDRASVRKNDPFSYPSRLDSIPSSYRIAWWSSDPGVVYFDSEGRLYAVAPGVAAVWVQVENARDSAVVRVASATDPLGPRYGSVGAGAHTCALTEAGEAYCWGADGYSALGRGVRRWFTQGAAPERVADGRVYEHLAVGGTHTCGLATGGNVWCWGKNFNGQLGNGERERDTIEDEVAFEAGEPNPVQVLGGIAFDTVVAQNETTCGLDVAGVAYCWGSNFTWQLGIGSSDTGDARAEPTAVAGGHSFRLLGAGSSHACGVTVDDETYCWGLHNWAAPSGPQQASFEPVLVATGLTFVQLAGGTAYSCGLTAGRETYCWGHNDEGQLGHADLNGSEQPTLLTGGVEFVVLTAGTHHTCGLTVGGQASCWGTNDRGQLGTGVRNFTANPDPTPVVGGLAFSTLSAAGSHTCGITTDGYAYCWGLLGAALGSGRIHAFDTRETQVSAAPVRVVAPIP